MKTKLFITALMVMAGISFASLGIFSAQAQTSTPITNPSATPTYDPFAQPPLPKNPTQLEEGRYLFWRYCMPCHGDVGQGLTDAFRQEWVSDHQNCWERGCHSGRYANDSFPVPTVVPPLANSGLLNRYTPDSLFAFLRATHPPEAPGSLTDDEYRALIAFLYHLNNVPLPGAAATPAPTLSPTPSASLTPTASRPPSIQADSTFWLWLALGLAVISVVFALLQNRSRAR